MAQTISQLYAARAGAGKPVSASKVSGGTGSTGNSKKKTISELYMEQAAKAGSGTNNSPAAGGGSPLYTRGPSAAEETKPKTISELYAEQAAKAPAYTVPAYTQPEDPMDAAIRRQKEIAEQYARAEREYKAAQADMQMMAMSGGLVSADAAAREQAAREAYQRAKEEYTQSREKAPDERQSWREAAQRQREAQAELELAAMSGGYAGADAAQRAVQAAQERENARQAYLTQRNQNIAQGDGTNAARGRDSLFRGAYDLADNRESTLPGSEYAALMGREDFAALSQAGESKLSWNPFRNDVLYDYINDINGARQVQDAQTMANGGQSYAKYALMTDQEIAVYNYLYASGGKKAADAFLKDLEPELDKQWYSGVSRQVTDWAEKNEATKAVASAATVAGKPVRDLTSLLATGEDAIRAATGQGINPYSELRTASRMTQDIRGAVSQDMGEVGQFAYNTAMSAADSAVGSFVASGIAQGIGAADVTKATATISSALMSSEVASLATAEAKEKGYSDLGALGLGLFRGAVEFASEKIGGEWVIRNMKKDPLNFMKTMVMNFIPEGTEEVMSDAANEAANLFIDWIFNTDESVIRQTYKYFSEKGTAEQKADPWLWTAMAMLKQEGLAFLGGGFATVGSTGAQYMNMQQSFRGAAEQLNTDNQTVVQLMEELRTEDPAAVAAMAEISGAESVEDFRAKMQALDLAAEEADAAMQGKKGKKEKAREPRTLGDLAKAWMEKYPDGSVPAPFAGMEDAIMKGDQNGKAGEQSIDAAPENGNDGVRTVGEGGQPGTVEGAQPGGEGQIREGVQEGAGENLRSVTLRELGVTNAAEGATITVQNENSLTGDAQKAAQQVRQIGMEPVAYQGDMIVNGQSVNGYIENGKIFFRTDAKYRDGTAISPEAIVRHEAVHQAKNADPEIITTGMEIVRQSRTEAEMERMMDAYRETYQDLYDFENMSEEEITQRLVEEIVADAYAGLNYFRKGGETVDQVRNAIGNQVENQTAETGQESTGPPEGKASAEDGKWPYIDKKSGDIVFKKRDSSLVTRDKAIQEEARRAHDAAATNQKNSPFLDGFEQRLRIDGTQLEDVQITPAGTLKTLTKKDLNGRLKDTIRQDKALFRGNVNNDDTGLTITVGNDGLADTAVYAARKDNLERVVALSGIEQLLKEAKVIGTVDTEIDTTKDLKNRNNPQRMFQYIFAAPFRIANGDRKVAVIRVDAMYNTGDQAIQRFYNLNSIDIINGASSSPGRKAFNANLGLNSAPTISIADMVSIVNPDLVGNHIAVAQQGMFSVEVPAGEAGEQTRKGYTVRDGVGKLFADQLDTLTEMADRQGIYYDGVQERLTDALVNAESEEDLDRRLAGMDSVRFAYSPELTEKLWELRELIQVDGERKQRGSSSPAAPQNDRKTKGETVQQEFDRLRAELDEPGHDAEYYQSRGRRLNELMEQGAKPAGSEQEERIAAPPAEARNDREEDKGRHRGPIGKDGIRTVKAEDAAEELMDIGEARVKNDAGTFLLSVRRKSDTNYLARVDHNGKLAASKSFETAEEAAAYAQSWVEGRTQGQEDAELDLEKSEYKEPQGMTEQLFDREAYQKEIDRQKKNKAAQAATQTLRERIRRAQSELNALRRLEKSTGLTEAQKKHKADVQETMDIMNDELTSRKGRRQAKKEKAKATGNKPTRSAAEAKNALMDLFHTPAGERIDTGRAIEQKLTEIFESGKLTDEGRQELFDLLMEKGETVKHAEQLYEAIRRDLKGTRIYVSEEDRKGYGDNWDDLRRRAWAAGIYLTNNINDKGADVHNLEFSEVYGERTFPTDIAAQDMLENMIELAEKGRPTKRSLREALEEEARQERMDPEEVFGDMWNRMEETLRTYAEKAGLEVDLKNRTASQLADERQRWQERMDKRSQARRESEIRGKLLNGLKRLERARNKTAPEIKSAIEEILRDIDTQARQITPSGLEDLQALQRAYLDARKAAGYENDENMGNWIPNPYVEKRLEALTKKHVNDMDLQEVIELGRTVAGLEHAIATHNQMIGEEWDSTIEQEANGVRDEVSAAKGAKPGFFQKWFMEEHLSPRRFLEMLGGWKDGSMKKLSRSLEDGQTRALDFQRRATQSFDPFLTKKENRKWLKTASGKKAVWEKYTVVDGASEDGASFTEIELTPMMKISLYLHSRNMDNLRHIQTGGIVIPNKELYKAGKIADAYELGDRVKMNPESVRKIAGELTDIEKTFANHMIRVFDTISKDAINEVSMQLDGFERAGVENYMPIETDRNFIKSDVAGEARAQTVEGIGSIANERIHASNPVMLIDASDVLTRQIDKVSRYYGYAIPIRNFQAVNNYVFHEEGAPFSTSVKELMGKKWGAGAEQYITKMLQDLQSSGRSSDMTSRALSALRGHLAGATLAFNPAVAVSQTASYPGAAQAVGWDGLAAGLIGGKVDTNLIEKYTPLYWYRNQGNSTQELGDVMKEKSMEQKLPWVFNWIQKMDSATIRRLWKAAEYRVSKDTGLKPGSQAEIDAGKDAYYKAVAEVFNRAVYDTQPNYTNMERAQILRSDSDLTRFLTMYKTVPLQYYGMMVEATGRLRAAAQSGDEAQIAKAQKYALDTFGGLLAANTVYVTIKALFKTFRKKDKDYRDEEGNITAGSYARQLGKDLVETYAGSIIGGSEALSGIQRLATGKKWTGPDMSSLSYVEEMLNALGDITDAMGEEDPRKAAKAIKNSAETLAMGFGVPAKNMETYIMATVRRISPRIGMEYDNLFGGIQKSDLKNMDEDAVSMAAGLILSNRTGVNLGKAVSDELARLYGAGETAAVPTSMPDSFTYNGTTVTIKDRTKYGETWGGVVSDNLEELIGSDHYQGASDKDKAKMVNRLYEYATVQARKGADPAYSADGNSTYGWTVKADEAVAAGIPLPETICALNAFAGMTADKDEDGNSISGSKKAKVCGYIDEMDLTVEQKDLLYLLSGYKENSLPYTPWHGWTEDGSGTSSRKGRSSGKRSGRSGGGRSRSRSGGRSSGNGAGPTVKLPGSGTAKAPSIESAGGTGSGAAAGKATGKTTGNGKAPTVSMNRGTGKAGSTKTTSRGIDARYLMGWKPESQSGTVRKGGDATANIAEIVEKYYDGNPLLALADGGRKIKGRTKVDFKL